MSALVELAVQPVAVHPTDFEILTFRSRRLPAFIYALHSACDRLAELDPTATAEEHKACLLAMGERTFRDSREV